MAFAFITATGTWAGVSTDGSDITVEAIGPGSSGNAGSNGGAGGAYAVKSSIPYVSGATVSVVVGAGNSGTDTSWNSGVVVAKAASGLTGGAAASCTPSAGAFSGGNGDGSLGGGGGAAGPNGAGAAGSAGGGGKGDNGHGGAGGTFNSASSPGSPGTEWDGSHGSGGGGGGWPGHTGGAGGNYGAGGGSGSGGTGGAGAPGLIVVTYTPAAISESITLGTGVHVSDSNVLESSESIALHTSSHVSDAGSLEVSKSIALGAAAAARLIPLPSENIALHDTLGISLSVNVYPSPVVVVNNGFIFSFPGLYQRSKRELSDNLKSARRKNRA